MQAVLADVAESTAPAFSGCFHCGLPISGPAYRVTVDAVNRDTCCRGCQAVAQTIADNGLASYYRHRSALPARPEVAADVLEQLRLYDLPEVQGAFVRAASPHEKEAALLLEGITCAACMWLVERRLAGMEGVTGVELNYAARRARVRWDERRRKLSDIMRSVAGLGYSAQPYDSARSEDARRRECRMLLWRLFVAGFGMMQVMMYAVPAYVSVDGMAADIEQLMRVASLILTLPVMLWSALPFYAGAWSDLRSRSVGMDVPVVIGIAVAFAASVYSTVRGMGEVYFDSVTMFVFLLLGARFLELAARTKALQAQDRLVKLVPNTAERRRDPESPTLEEVPVALLRAGDVVQVRPGAAVPADGRIISGVSAVDESLLSGEARPVHKAAGDCVVGGAVNLHGPFVMRVEHVGADTVISGIVRLMDRAQSDRPRIARVADHVARWFVAALLAVAAATAVAWYAVDPARALWVTVAVLVVTCPCALSLATPAALTAATGALHGMGMLVTRGHAMEALANATHFVFDKTGTLTEGRMSLVGVIPLGAASRIQCLAWAAGMEAASEHAIGRALLAAAHEEAVAPSRTAGVRNAPGCGVEARVDGRRMRIGTPAYVAALHGMALPRELQYVSDDVTVIALGDEHGWFALFTLGDSVRRNARGVVQDLQGRGRTVVLLSGDRPATVSRIARELGVAEAHGGATPEQKREFVRALQAQGAVVAMVGDGVNDAPVLAQAQLSIALGSGTSLARMNSDMVLTSERLDTLVAAYDASRRALRVIRQNLAWALAYNVVALPLAVLGHVTPLVAAIGMSSSSLLVVLNALRLLRPSRM